MKKLLFILFAFAFIGLNAQVSKNKIATQKVYTNEIVPYQNGTAVTINGIVLPTSGIIKPVNSYKYFAKLTTDTYNITLTKDTWKSLSNIAHTLWTTEKYYGISKSNDTIIITNAGLYEGLLQLSFTGHDSDLISLRIYNITDSTFSTYSGDVAKGAVKYGQIVLPFYLDVSANRKFLIQVVNRTSSNAIVPKYATLHLKYINEK